MGTRADHKGRGERRARFAYPDPNAYRMPPIPEPVIVDPDPLANRVWEPANTGAPTLSENFQDSMEADDTQCAICLSHFEPG